MDDEAAKLETLQHYVSPIPLRANFSSLQSGDAPLKCPHARTKSISRIISSNLTLRNIAGSPSAGSFHGKGSGYLDSPGSLVSPVPGSSWAGSSSSLAFPGPSPAESSPAPPGSPGGPVIHSLQFVCRAWALCTLKILCRERATRRKGRLHGSFCFGYESECSQYMILPQRFEFRKFKPPVLGWKPMAPGSPHMLWLRNQMPSAVRPGSAATTGLPSFSKCQVLCILLFLFPRTSYEASFLCNILRGFLSSSDF